MQARRQEGPSLIHTAGAMRAPASSSLVRFLRYRFTAPEELTHHLHVRDDCSAFFFYPTGSEGELPLPPGARVVLEVAFGGLNRHSVLHGFAAAVTPEGAWLCLAAADSLVRWSKVSPALPRRRYQRVATDLPVRVAGLGWPSASGRAVELGERGARLRVPRALPDAGESVWVRLGAEAGQADLALIARVAWRDAGELGIEFGEADAAAAGLSGRVAAIQAQWSQSAQREHPLPCRCVLGFPPMGPELSAELRAQR